MRETPKSRARKPARKQPPKPAAKAVPKRRPGRPRKVEPAERKAAILDAALHVFAERGFEAARLDDVAARSGVAKGTLYLYFKDKEALFEEVVRSAVSPVLERLEAVAAGPELPFDKVLDAIYELFVTEVLGTERKLLIRLILAEGPRFPRIAEFYYRNVVGRALPQLQKLAERAKREGALTHDSIARYPQLIVAPLLMAVIWDAQFARFKPLDASGFLRAYREMVAPGKRRSTP